MENFLKVASGLNTEPLRLSLERQPELFGRHGERKYVAGSPHAEMTDLWVRYADYRPFEASGDWSGFRDPHQAVWYPEAAAIPEIRPVVFDLMRIVEAEFLAGVLITKLPPGGRIGRHVDGGWHAATFHKFFVPINNAPGAKFCFEEGELEPVNGDAWLFRNDVPHWVVNDSTEDRVAMIVCLGFSASMQ